MDTTYEDKVAMIVFQNGSFSASSYQLPWYTMTMMPSVDVPPSVDTQSSSLSEIEPKGSAPLDPATSKILIIGAGTLGLSTAYHLQEDKFRHVVVLDRADELPARDAASTDIDKGVYHVLVCNRIHHLPCAMTYASATRTRLTMEFGCIYFQSSGRRMVTSSTILGLNERLLRCGRIQWEDCYHE